MSFPTVFCWNNMWYMVPNYVFVKQKTWSNFVFLVIIAVKEIDIDRVLKLCSMFWIVTFVLKVTLSLCGIIPTVYGHKDNAIYGVREVSGLGYPHPNNAYLVFAISIILIFISMIFQADYIQ